MNEEKILIESNQPDVRLFDSFLSSFSPKFKVNVGFKVVIGCTICVHVFVIFAISVARCIWYIDVI